MFFFQASKALVTQSFSTIVSLEKYHHANLNTQIIVRLKFVLKRPSQFKGFHNHFSFLNPDLCFLRLHIHHFFIWNQMSAFPPIFSLQKGIKVNTFVISSFPFTVVSVFTIRPFVLQAISFGFFLSEVLKVATNR